MLDYRGFSAWITSDDLELVEFEPRTNRNNHTVTCWISGTSGKTFIVHWRDHGSKVDSASYIYFDGFKVSGQFLYGKGEELRRGVRVGSEEERPFVFSTIEHSDTSGLNGKPADKNVGSIVLEIRLVKRVDEREPNPIRPPPNVVRGLRQEGDVAIRYGDVRPASTQKRTWKIEPFDPKAPGPYVTFVFRYRSQEWLVSQGIIADNEGITRVPNHPPANSLSVADLPPIEQSDDEEPPAPEPVSVPASPNVLHSPVPSPALAPSPLPYVEQTGMFDSLSLGPRPQAPTESGRVASDSSIRSFSGTWDPTPDMTAEYEEWDEYRPEDFNEAVDNYY
ncbi:hypothetical protein C8Q80DRAFT_1270558 [Daedaleopsis nitida]|nr:hypothetical protein C8Q80DRAFT_1270558 [Daedaleopsis nitida]